MLTSPSVSLAQAQTLHLTYSNEITNITKFNSASSISAGIPNANRNNSVPSSSGDCLEPRHPSGERISRRRIYKARKSRSNVGNHPVVPIKQRLQVMMLII